MAQLFDIDGKEVEAFTQDELKAKQDEAVAEHLKNNPDKSAEVTKLKEDLEKVNKDLEAAKGGGNDQQKARLKDAKEAAEAALKEVTDKLTGEINVLKETFTSGTKTKLLTALSKGDKDVAAKLELKYNSLMKTGDFKMDEAGITQAMTEAATIVTGSKPVPGFLDGMSNAGEKGGTRVEQNAKPESENSKAMRQAFGITDKEATKYGGVDATK